MAFVYTCGLGGTGTVTITSQGVVRAPDCKNGTGVWVELSDEINGGVEAYLQSNPIGLQALIDDQIVAFNQQNPGLDVAAVDERIAAYFAEHPVSTDVSCCTAAQLEVIGVDAESIAVSVAFGFGIVVMFWGVGYVGGMLVRAIKEA